MHGEPSTKIRVSKILSLDKRMKVDQTHCTRQHTRITVKPLVSVSERDRLFHRVPIKKEKKKS